MKTVARILMTTSIVVLITSAISAQNNTGAKGTKTPPSTNAANRGQFVDNNNNGICDNFEARGQSGRGANFVDKNVDGVCDNRGKVGKGNGRGNGCGQGYQHRHGQGKGKGNCCGRGKGRCRGNFDAVL